MGSDQDLRTEYLKLRAALYDPNTRLRSVPAVLEAVRGLFDLGRWVGLIHLAADPLRRIESIYGWQSTDRLLRTIASTLESCVGKCIPAESVIAQSGIYGGCFATFLPIGSATTSPLDLLEKAASAIASKLEEQFAAAEYRTMSPRLSFRTGFSAFTNEPFFRLERIVYRALDEAASVGGGGEARRRNREQTELKRILRERDIDVVFQPVVQLDETRIIGFEAFCRGPRNSTLEQPRALFATSSDASMARELDLLCQRRALEGARGMGAGVKLFLNALPDSLLDPGFRDHLLRDLPDGLPFREEDIVLEIADRDAIGDYRHFEAEVGELRTRGFRLGVDDVGTGSRSLQTITEVKPDYIKVDRSLIRNIQNNLVKQEMLRSLSNVARSIEAILVAEGIESGEELAAVKSCGVHYGQGFLFSAPRHDFPATLGGH